MTKRLNNAPPLLFVHGAWHGKWCYETFFLPYLQEQGFRVHAIDLPGHGAEFKGTSDIRFRSIDDYVHGIYQAALRLDESPIIIGHSMGGFVVQHYLNKYHCAGSVLLASVPHYGVYKTTLRILLNDFVALLKTSLTLSLKPIIANADKARALFFSEWMPNNESQQYYEQMHDESYRAFLDMLFKLPRPGLNACPMLVLGGQKDTIFLPEEVIDTAQAYHCDYQLFDDMAHDMMLEKDWKAVADAIANWALKLGEKR